MDGVVGVGQVLGYDVGGEVVFGIVGVVDCFVFVVIDQDVYYWVEDFFVDDGYVVVVIGEYGWCDVGVIVECFIGYVFVVVQQVSFLCFVGFDVVEYVFYVWEVDQWVEVGVFVLWVVEMDVLYVFQYFGFEVSLLGMVDEYLGVVGVDLVGVEEVGYDGDVGGVVEVCVGEDDQWGFVVQFYGYFFQ